MTEMTRAEALKRAIAAATYADRATAGSIAAAQAHIAEAWIAIHDRLPVTRPQWPGPTVEEDIRKCGHGVTAWLYGDHWVHPGAMDECDNPPVTDGPLP